MISFEEPVRFHFPVLENSFTTDEIQEALSLLQSGMPVHSTSGSERSRSVYSNEERKRRRMISNRESARRSRWRKKRQLEDLADEANRLKIENQQLMNQFCLVAHEYYMVQGDTDRLMAESSDLQRRLAGLDRILVTLQLHLSSSTIAKII